MRWNNKTKEPKAKPKIGDKRVRSGFLWFPKKCGNQTRWLEYARWGEVFKCRGTSLGVPPSPSTRVFGWDATRWMD